MSSASPGATHRKLTRCPGRKASSLRPESNTSVTAGGRVVKDKCAPNIKKFHNLKIFSLLNEFPDIIRTNLSAYCMQIALILKKLRQNVPPRP